MDNPDNDVDFNRVLQQSAEEHVKIRAREEEDLARALEESLVHTSPPPSLRVHVQPTPHASPSSHESQSTPSTLSPPAYTFLSPDPPASSVYLPFAYAGGSSQRTDVNLNPVSYSPQIMHQQIIDDEAFARSLLEEEQRAFPATRVGEQAGAQTNQDTSYSLPMLPAEHRLPRYSTIISLSPHSSPAAISPSMNSAPHSMSTSPYRRQSSENSRLPSTGPVLDRSTSANVVPIYHVHHPDTRASRSRSFGAYGAAARPQTNAFPSEHSQSRHTGASSTISPQSIHSVQEHSPTRSGHDSSLWIQSTSSQYIDDELLKGVTIDFSPATVTAELIPMKGPIANVIRLPYGRTSPLHMKAPNWYNMLKLMASLSHTRLAPAVEALASTNIPMQLRVVVNFVKVHRLSNDWHVVLYMTIDHPLPNSQQYQRRHMSDPTSLPYSYTLSPRPNLLRGSADGPLSKWYTIPLSEDMPYPTLPITFPDLAAYLLSALENSQRAINDRSCGLYRLAKYIETFYPGHAGGATEEEQHRGVLGRFFGRSSSSKPKHSNDERSNLVTPFFPDDYGG